MNKYLQWSIYSFYFTTGITFALVITYFLIPNANIEIMVVYLLISNLSMIVSIVLFGIGTETKPKDEEDEIIRKRASWPL
jgi:hypothetical protein